MLKYPSEYIEALERLRKRNPYAKNWKLRLMRKTNRHANTDGSSWGWYEVSPLGETVGYWSSDRRDDLRDVDIAAWNNEAEILSKSKNEL